MNGENGRRMRVREKGNFDGKYDNGHQDRLHRCHQVYQHRQRISDLQTVRFGAYGHEQAVRGVSCLLFRFASAGFRGR